jgi:hypothetical protein
LFSLKASTARPIAEWLGNEMEVIVDALIPALAQQAAGESG